MSKKPLNCEFDATVWAKEFMDIFGDKLNTIDESLMHTWFANAIMCGWDHYNWANGSEVKAKEISSGRPTIPRKS